MTIAARLDDIVLEHGSNVVILRPSLRAASQLERLHEGFPALFRRVTEFDLGTIYSIIRSAATDRKDAAAFISAMSRQPLQRVLEITQAPVATLCLKLIPADNSDEQKPAPNAKPVPWPKFFRDLFGIATGWLGWTPDAAWNAAPTEITIAYKAHVAMLRAIHGAAEAEPETQLDPNGKLDRAGLDKLRGKGRLR